MSGPLLAEDGARFTATIKRTEDGPPGLLSRHPRRWQTVDGGEGHPVVQRQTLRPSTGLRWKLIGAASQGGNAFGSEREGFCAYATLTFISCISLAESA